MQARPLTIGIITLEGGYYYGPMLSGIHQVCRAAGVPLLVFRGGLEDLRLSPFGAAYVAGWIVLHPLEQARANLEALVATGVPVVTVPTAPEGIPYSLVAVDNRGDTRALVRHLIDHGHRRIAYIDHGLDSWSRERYQGYLEALHEGGIAPDPALVIDTTPIREAILPLPQLERCGEVTARELIARGMPCTALVAGTDQSAIAAMQAFQAAGYRVPEDVAVVGFDDIAEAQYAEPPLTTVRTRFDICGRTAIEHLLAVLRGERDPRPTQIRVSSSMLCRRSCGCAGVEEIQFRGVAALAAASSWQSALAEQLAVLISYPLAPEPGTPPDQIWPGVSTLIAAVEAALQGQESSVLARDVELAWQQAVVLTQNQDLLDAALTLLEDAAEQRLATVPAAANHARTMLSRQMRKAMLRAWMGYEAAKNKTLTTVSRTNQYISLMLLSSQVGERQALAWLGQTPAMWGCLALWDTAPPGTSAVLTVAGIYQPDCTPQIALGNCYPALEFPPFAALPLPARQGHDLTIVLPLRAEADDLGVLVLCGFANYNFTFNSTYTLGVQALLLSAALKRDAQAQELAQARDAAEKANQAKSAFLATMSHELRTPLNGILGYTQILKRRHLDQDTTKGLQVIEQSGAHLLTLINDILDLAKIEAGRLELAPTPLHLPSFLRSIVEIIHARAQAKQLTVAFEPLPNLPEWMRADETRLRQILLNLLGNAVKFTDQGQVTLRVMTAASAHVGRQSSVVRFEIADTGPGIPTDELARIFHLFEQSGERARREGGAGLGLAISRQLVRAMGGEIQVASVIGQGSTFWFELTVPVLEVLVHTPSATQVVIGYTGPRRSLLVVDDNTINRTVLAELLAGLGFTVYQAANGQEGVEQAQVRQPDLILMDRSMPVLEGLEAIRRIRQIAVLQQTPIIVVSASVMALDRAASLAAGANAFVPKPIRQAELLEQIGRLLHIDWVEAQPVAEPEDAVAQADLPPDEAQRLYSLARQGLIMELRERLEVLERQGLHYSSCVVELRQLAQHYRLREIRAVLEPYLREESNGD